MKLLRFCLVMSVLTILVSCAGEPDPPVLIDSSGLATKTDTTRFCTLLFPNGQVTLNDRCPVLKGGLNTRMPAIYVNQKPIGFC